MGMLFAKNLKKIRRFVELPSGFCFARLCGDDTEFVIKRHLMIRSAVELKLASTSGYSVVANSSATTLRARRLFPP